MDRRVVNPPCGRQIPPWPARKIADTDPLKLIENSHFPFISHGKRCIWQSQRVAKWRFTNHCAWDEVVSPFWHVITSRRLASCVLWERLESLNFSVCKHAQLGTETAQLCKVNTENDQAKAMVMILHPPREVLQSVYKIQSIGQGDARGVSEVHCGTSAQVFSEQGPTYIQPYRAWRIGRTPKRLYYPLSEPLLRTLLRTLSLQKPRASPLLRTLFERRRGERERERGRKKKEKEIEIERER